MNVYDFDKTIMDTDSSGLFLMYCLKKMPRIFLKGIGGKASSLFAWLSGKETVDRFKENMFSFLKYVPDPEALIETFWDENMSHVEPYYKELHRSDDVVISASPDFLVRPAAERLDVSLIATDMSVSSGLIRGLNCKGQEKVRRFRECYPDAHVEAFYSDSLSDTPMAELADAAYLIVDHKPEPWPEK